jgi:homoaconitase/3-isopropylmalate dehydratase large subunit
MPRMSSCRLSAVSVSTVPPTRSSSSPAPWWRPWTWKRMTLCNMAIEAGATCGICAPDRVTVDYLWPFIKDDFTTRRKPPWRGGTGRTTTRVTRQTIDHDVSHLSPMVDLRLPAGQRQTGSRYGCPTPVDQVYIGSCTNGRISDLRHRRPRADRKADQRQGAGHRLPGHTPRSIVRPWRRG